MKMKRLLALAMAATLFVSSSLMDTGMVNAYAKEAAINKISEGRKLDAEKKIEGKENEKESDWNGVLEVPEDKKLKEFDRVADKEELKEVTAGVQAGENAMAIADKKKVDTSKIEKPAKEESGTEVKKVDRSELDVDLTRKSEVKTLDEQTVQDEDMVRVIIVMDGESVIEKDADATMNFVNKIRTAWMEKEQDMVVSRIEKKVLDKQELNIRYHYTWLLNGVATEVPYGMIDEIEAISGVKEVLLQPVYEVSKEEMTPYTVSDGGMIGRDDTWASGYTGKGIKIAIVDTGLDTDHQNFAAMDEDKLTEDSTTADAVEAVLPQLNSYKLYNGLNIDQVYYSNKVAYGFNYVDNTLDITHDNDTQGDHGTHVAGIAAANDLHNDEAVGVAPDAQLYVMKVFGKAGGSYTEDILASLEDALLLEADVVNMSLGSPAGFTTDGEAIQEIYGRVSETNTVLAIAAGNAATSGAGNFWGTDSNLASNPDNSTVSSPATYTNVTSVASVNNVGMKSYYIDVNGNKYAYAEGANGSNQPLSTISGQDLDFAMVGNAGQTLGDFTAADVAGKVAFVQRGVTSFTDKVMLAEQAGAVACIVYNNIPGTINMDLTGCTAVIPSASITRAAGEAIAAAKAENPDMTIQFSTKLAVIGTEDGYKMSDFSSWGISPDLSLEPDITAPGGNIYSTLDNGQYGVMSGTSMACPNLAGIAALVMQHTKAQYPDMSESEMHHYVNALLMSTSVPLMYDEEVTYSPRNQGSGLANAYNAINTKAYLSVDANDMPKVELGDDPAKTGNYNYSFHVNNFGDKDLYYDVDTSVETEDVWSVEELGKDFMAMTPIALDAATAENSDQMIYTYDYNENGVTNTADARQLYLKVTNGEASEADEFFRYNLDNDEDADNDDVQAYLDALVDKDVDVNLKDQVVKVNAGETADINVNVAVSEAGKAYMDKYFENGIYVEGFTVLSAKNAGGVDLSIPYLGFYGDWTQAPIIDNGFYWQDEDEMEASQYPNILFTQFGGQDWVPGLNPYFDEEFDQKHISLSPNGDNYADYLTDIYIGLLRNAATLGFTYEDAETGEVYFDTKAEHISKSFFANQYNQIIPYVYSWDNAEYKLTDAEGKVLANNTKLNLKIAATVDYDKHESNNKFDTWNVPITVDTEAPVVNEEKTEVVVDQATGKQYLNLTFTDNVDVAAVNIMNKSGTQVLAQYPADDITPGEEITMKFDVTGYGNKFAVILGDYALNESAYSIKTTGNDPVLDMEQLYGYRVFDDQYHDDRVYGWVGINKEDASTVVYDSEYYMDYAFTAADYAGGYIVGVDANNDLVSVKPGYWDERTKIASLGKKINEMAFDATTQTMYAYNTSDWKIDKIDIVTGEMTRVTKGYITDIVTMTCGDDGTLYGINKKGELRVINKETGAFETEVLLNTKDVTGRTPAPYYQSMTYVSDEDCIYWAAYFYTAPTGKGILYKIDVNNNYEMTTVGTIAGNAEIVGLMNLDTKGFELPKDAEMEDFTVAQQGVVLVPGMQEKVIPVRTPWYANSDVLKWSSENNEVATVDEEGVVTAVSEGRTVVTVETENGKYSAKCDVNVVSPQAQITGFVMGSNNLLNQWVTADTTDLKKYEVLTEIDFMSYTAGEYVDGTIYAYNTATEFYKIDAETKKATKIADPLKNYQIIDMSYDYSTGYMYGLAQSVLDGMTYLAHIDMNTGAVEMLDMLMDAYNTPMCAMAVSTDGTIYMISYTGLLNTYNPETGEMTKIGLTGYAGSQMLQTMAYDHNTDSLYWSMVSAGGLSSLMYVDTVSGKALPLGAIDGGCQMTAMYIVPENAPAHPDVAVTSVRMLQDTLPVLENSTKVIPVEVQPFNASDRNVEWTVADPEVAEVNNGAITGKAKGETTVTGKLADFEVSFTVKVIPSAKEIRGYVLADIATGAGQFWGAFDDRDLSSGEGIISDGSYMLYAGEYYDGKVYGYGVDYETYESQFMVFDGETLKLEKTITGEYPDIRDMAFDYSEGCMYAVGGVRNVHGDTKLYAIDTETGRSYEIGGLGTEMFGLACSTDGILYGVDMEGILYTIDKETAKLTVIGETGYYGNQYQSMAYDHNTGNLYWAQIYNDPFAWVTTASLLLVDPEDASVVDLGQVGTAGCEIGAMHIIPNDGIKAQTPEVSKLVLSSSSEVLKPGDKTTISGKAFPLSVNLKDVEINYASSDDTVATVNKDGVITAVGEGKAQIVASYGDVTAECTVNVLGENTKLHVVNNGGWEVSPLLYPKKIDSKVTFPNGMKVTSATLSSDGYFYAVGEDGYLWKYTEDLSYVEKIGEKAIAEQLDNLGDFNENYIPSIVDIAAENTTGKVYVLAAAVAGSGQYAYYVYELYELNLETAAATKVGEVPMEIDRPVAMTFMDEDTIAVYDGYDSYMYSMELGASEWDPATSLVWTQNVVTAGVTMGMVYSQELNRIFLATADDYNNHEIMALYVMNPEKGTIAKIGDAAYNQSMVDLILVGDNK